VVRQAIHRDAAPSPDRSGAIAEGAEPPGGSAAAGGTHALMEGTRAEHHESRSSEQGPVSTRSGPPRRLIADTHAVQSGHSRATSARTRGLIRYPP